MNTTTKLLELRQIEFTADNLLSVHLSNARTVLVSLDKFPSIAQLDSGQRKDFEIIDYQYLSFLAIDEIYSIEELIK